MTRRGKHWVRDPHATKWEQWANICDIGCPTSCFSGWRILFCFFGLNEIVACPCSKHSPLYLRWIMNQSHSFRISLKLLSMFFSFLFSSFFLCFFFLCVNNVLLLIWAVKFFFAPSPSQSNFVFQSCSKSLALLDVYGRKACTFQTRRSAWRTGLLLNVWLSGVRISRRKRIRTLQSTGQKKINFTFLIVTPTKKKMKSWDEAREEQGDDRKRKRSLNLSNDIFDYAVHSSYQTPN